MKTVVGLFDTYAHAETAAHDLGNAGISQNDISLVANNTSGKYGQPISATGTTASYPNVASETATGAVEGGIAGLLLGLVAFAIPGLGAVAAAGWLTTAITGVVVGAGVGLVGALMGAGIPHEDAAYYAEGVRRGGTLLAVRTTDEQAQRIAQILSNDGAVNIEERAEQYRQEGFVPTATQQLDTTPMTVNAVPIGRGVEPLSGGHTGRTTGYDAYESDFRNNWRTNYGNQGGTYEDYAVAYRYGYEVSSDPRYRGRDWNSVQYDLQRDWETRQPGTWDRMKNPVRYAWDKATGAERGGIQTGGHALDGTPDTRGITEKIADTVTGDRIDDKTGKPV
jgi:hypothetical protein